MQYRYYSKGAQMSADLKRVAHRVRTSRPELFAERQLQETVMDGDGRVITVTRKVAKANTLSGSYRHSLSTKRD